jgi:hypothetical protein
VLSEEDRYGGLRHLPLGNAERQILKGIGSSLDLAAVEFEKDQGGFKAHPLVSVDKGMILHDVEKVCCRHLEHIAMEEFAPKRSLRLRYRRL